MVWAFTRPSENLMQEKAGQYKALGLFIEVLSMYQVCRFKLPDFLAFSVLCGSAVVQVTFIQRWPLRRTSAAPAVLEWHDFCRPAAARVSSCHVLASWERNTSKQTFQSWNLSFSNAKVEVYLCISIGTGCLHLWWCSSHRFCSIPGSFQNAKSPREGLPSATWEALAFSSQTWRHPMRRKKLTQADSTHAAMPSQAHSTDGFTLVFCLIRSNFQMFSTRNPSSRNKGFHLPS